MTSLTAFLAILQIVVALFMAVAILLQDSKGDLGAALGGGSNQSLFGATGAATFLVKVTRALGFIFMVNCFALTILLSKKSGHSVVDNLPTTSTKAPTAAPAPPATAPNTNTTTAPAGQPNNAQPSTHK